MGRGHVLQTLGRGEEALTCWVSALEKKPELARAEVEKAVKLAPNYAEARQLLEHLEKGKPTGGAQ